jgi:hypothetical protein
LPFFKATLGVISTSFCDGESITGMKRVIRIAFGSIALLLAIIAGGVCGILAVRMHEIIHRDGWIVLNDKYKLEGWHIYFIPVFVGLFALSSCAVGLYLILSRPQDSVTSGNDSDR